MSLSQLLKNCGYQLSGLQNLSLVPNVFVICKWN